MPTAPRLSSPDLDAALRVVAEAFSADGAQPFELPLVERLLVLVPADRAGYYENPTGTRPNLFEVEQPWFDFGWEHIDPELISLWPLNNSRMRSVTTAVRFSDFVSHRERLRDPWYNEVMRPRSVEYECKLVLPAPSGIDRGFFFVRSADGQDFGQRDLSVLTLLRPHLAATRDRWEQRHCPAGLSGREIGVLTLLREGLTNKEIAQRLEIAPGTVQTHLENIFSKLGVHTRTAAVARAFNGGP
jgi:DNA-binding CsgD family transcriptional regulator